MSRKCLNDCPISCELNKFDSMMEHLYLRFRQGFLQVIAIDKNFDMFSRAWCIAELAQAHATRMEQHLVVHSAESLENQKLRLRSLRVENCYASRPEDKQEILSKIGSASAIRKFNDGLQKLLLGSPFCGYKVPL